MTAQDKTRCVTAQDKTRCVAAQDKTRCVAAQDKTRCVAAQDKTRNRSTSLARHFQNKFIDAVGEIPNELTHFSKTTKSFAQGGEPPPPRRGIARQVSLGVGKGR
ncbi:MAG: hypothetical protein EGR22_07625 [Ruminococcaceae bacterium]|nr:hypothetical protein [Oscillospiraceae bacterium]